MNNTPEAMVPLAGSNVVAPRGHRVIGQPDPNARIVVTAYLRPPPGVDDSALHAMAHQAPADRRYLTHEEYEQTYGASEADIDRVRSFAREHGLVVQEVNRAARTVDLAGTISAVAEAFNVEMHLYNHPSTGTYRGRVGPVSVPASLRGVVEAVHGFTDRPFAESYARRARVVLAPEVAAGGFTGPQLASMYDFPTGVSGAGQCIGIIELGGGYTQADLASFWQGIRVSPPTVVAVGVDGGANTPQPAHSPTDPDPDLEVALDIEVAGGVAPGAKIVVYFAPNTLNDFIKAVNAAATDTVNRPGVLSISWGAAEASWAGATAQMDQACQAAGAKGITVCVASGDDGSAGAFPPIDSAAHAGFPASSPNVLGCGGTQVTNSGATITSEVAWQDPPPGAGQRRMATGGGISDVFPVPSYQTSASIPASANPSHNRGRGVPDVSGAARLYAVTRDGADVLAEGTSAVAPLWAGLIALVNQKLGHNAGFINPAIYGASSRASGAFRDITTGTNGAYRAGPGWDACTGLGSPDGNKLVQLLSASGPSPTPTPAPTPTPTPVPTPTPTPTPVPSQHPSPSPMPSQAPSPKPSQAPSPKPSQAPSPAPSQAPSPGPSQAPSPAPSQAPSPAPSQAPSPAPSQAPSPAPSQAPSPGPSQSPSGSPAPSPSVARSRKARASR